METNWNLILEIFKNAYDFIHNFCRTNKNQIVFLKLKKLEETMAWLFFMNHSQFQFFYNDVQFLFWYIYHIASNSDIFFHFVSYRFFKQLSTPFLLVFLVYSEIFSERIYFNIVQSPKISILAWDSYILFIFLITFVQHFLHITHPCFFQF